MVSVGLEVVSLTGVGEVVRIAVGVDVGAIGWKVGAEVSGR